MEPSSLGDRNTKVQNDLLFWDSLGDCNIPNASYQI